MKPSKMAALIQVRTSDKFIQLLKTKPGEVFTARMACELCKAGLSSAREFVRALPDTQKVYVKNKSQKLWVFGSEKAVNKFKKLLP